MALGRGLGALISTTVSKEKNDQDNNKVWAIPLSKITADPQQPRRHFAPEELSELAASIRQHGILQPLLLTEKSDGGYEIVAGERRYRAARLAGLATVPAVVKKTLAGQEKLEMALIENIQREDLNPIEEAFAYKRLIEEFNLTQQMVAEKVGKSRPVVANTVRLLELPEPAQTALVEGKINTGQARALLSLEDSKKQLDTLSSMLGQKITVRELERTAAQDKIKRGEKTRRDPNLLYLEEKLREIFKTKVGITSKGQSGTVVFDYYSKEELERLLKKMGAL